MTPWYRDPKQVRKGLAALTAFAGILVSQGLLSGTAEAVVNGAIGLVGALAVIFLPNEQPIVGGDGLPVAESDL